MRMGQLNMNWHTYSDHLKEMMENLMNSSKSADVTLVSEDKTKFKAHKFILSACSPLFKSIIDELPYKEESFIYLRGVQPQEMKSILQFIYLGQTTIHQDSMNELLNVAKSLEIKEISKDDEMDDVYTTSDDEIEDNFETFTENDKISSNGGQENDEHSIKLQNAIVKNYKSPNNKSYLMEEINQTDKKFIVKDEAGQYKCDKCEKHFLHLNHLYRHSRGVHEGVRYPCNICKKTFIEKRNLKLHIESIHQGIKYSCDLCDSVFTQKCSLFSHMKKKHIAGVHMME